MKRLNASITGGMRRYGSPNPFVENVPEKRVRYVNFYDVNYHACEYSSRELADAGQNRNHRRIACVRVEYEEGQFDD